MSTASNSQDQRLGKLYTALSFNTLSLLRFDGMDAVNECFEYHVEAVTDDDNVDVTLDDLIGTHMTVELPDLYGNPKYFDGIVTEAGWAGDGDTGNAYRFTLRPWFWVMSKRKNNKIYQNKSFQDIIEEVCSDFGGDAAQGLEVQLTGQAATATREYIVQYGESDFHFLSRLMERYGVNYFFKHDSGEHKMVLTDSNDNFAMLSPNVRRYEPQEGQHVQEEEHFWDWTPHRRLTGGKVAMTDYNFKTPTANMVSEQTGDAAYSYGDIESYEYPGVYEDSSEGSDFARIRTEQLRARDKSHIASGDVLSLSSGMKVTVEGNHQDSSIDGTEFVCVRAMHSFSTGGYRSSGGGGAGGQEEIFVGNYEMVPSDVPYAPERKTPETRMTGPQTATVVGKSGEEIDVDEYGRIVCHFHWDRLGKKDENSSMRVRVVQPWAGKGWGTLFIPRIGMEVIVEFLEGDPNKPVVTGTVYHADNMHSFEMPAEEFPEATDTGFSEPSGSPLALPDNKNWSGMQSSSTTGGAGHNSVLFNDTAGEELFYQHAQYNMQTTVLNDERREVKNNRTTVIGADETRQVNGNEDHTIDGNNTYLIKGDENRTVNGDQELIIGGKRLTEIAGSDTLNVQGKIAISSLQEIKLSVGSSSITIDNTSIKLSAPMIDINANANLTTNGGAMATHKAGGMMTIQAALVKIN